MKKLCRKSTLETSPEALRNFGKESKAANTRKRHLKF